MKKIIILVSLFIFIIVGLFFLFGRERLQNILNNNPEFGTFFNTPNQSQNQFPDNFLPDTEEPFNPNLPYRAPVLRQISLEPVSGFTSFIEEISEEISVVNENKEQILEERIKELIVIRFQERATGHIYDVFERAAQPQLVSNSTIPKIYRTIFTNNKNVFLYQFLDQDGERIISKTGEIVEIKNEQEEVIGIQTISKDFSSAINNVVYNKNSGLFFYSIQEVGVSRIFSSNPDRTNEKEIITLSFNEFLLEAINLNEVLITTKASHNTPGYAYILNTNTGAFSRFTGGQNGLLIKLNSQKDSYIISQSEQTRPLIESKHLNDPANLLFIDTIPEKCVFSNKEISIAYCFGAPSYVVAKYPDDWYKGKIQTTDSLYQVNTLTGEVDSLFFFETETDSFGLFDVINPQISDNDSHIIFQNKRDLTLWAIDLNQLKGFTEESL